MKASDFFDHEASESEDENLPRLPDEPDEDDAPNDYIDDGFLVRDEDIEEDGASSAGSDAYEEADLDEDDLLLLQESGQDVSRELAQVRRRQEEAAQVRRRQETRERQAAGLAADDQEREARRVKKAAAPEPDMPEGYQSGIYSDDEPEPRRQEPRILREETIGDEEDDFIVDDRGRPQPMDGTGDVTNDQMAEVMDLFGDTDVLNPLDILRQEHEGGEEEGMEEEEEEEDFDQDEMEKHYMTPHDRKIQKRDIPERFIERYGLDENAYDRDDVEKEAVWMYFALSASFAESMPDEEQFDDWKQETTDKIEFILYCFRKHFLEPAWIWTHRRFVIQPHINEQQLWQIYEMDPKWQQLCKRGKKLNTRLANVKDSEETEGVEYVKADLVRKLANIDEKTFEYDVHLNDVQEYLNLYAPDIDTNLKTHRQAIFQSGKYTKHYKKLAEHLALKPHEMSANCKAALEANHPDLEYEYVPALRGVSPEQVVEPVATQNEQEPSILLQAVAKFMAKQLAVDPNIRDFVRKHFHDALVIFTYPTSEVTPKSRGRNANVIQLAARPYWTFLTEISDLKIKDQEDDREDRVHSNQGLMDFVAMEHARRLGLLKVDWALSLEPVSYIPKDESDPIEDEFLRFKMMIPGYTDDEVQVLEDDVLNKNESDLNPKQQGWKQRRDQLKLLVTKLQEEVDPTMDAPEEYFQKDAILEALSMFYMSKDCVAKSDKDCEWVKFRRSVLRRLLVDELYPKLWREAYQRMLYRGYSEVAMSCGEKFRRTVGTLGWKPQESFSLDCQQEINDYLYEQTTDMMNDSIPELERIRDSIDNQRKGIFHCVGISIENQGVSAKMNVVCVNDVGDVVWYQEMSYLHKAIDTQQRNQRIEKANRNYQTLLQTNPEEAANSYKPTGQIQILPQSDKDDITAFEEMLNDYIPALIVIPCTGRNAIKAEKMLYNYLRSRSEQKVPGHQVRNPDYKVMVCDPTIPRLVTYKSQLWEKDAFEPFREKPLLRHAISAARMAQNPLLETLLLWDEDPSVNSLLDMNVHDLQSVIPRPILHATYQSAIIRTVNTHGLNINRVFQADEHLRPALTFINGLGPRKAALLVNKAQGLAGHVSHLERRQHLLNIDNQETDLLTCANMDPMMNDDQRSYRLSRQIVYMNASPSFIFDGKDDGDFKCLEGHDRLSEEEMLFEYSRMHQVNKTLFVTFINALFQIEEFAKAYLKEKDFDENADHADDIMAASNDTEQIISWMDQDDGGRIEIFQKVVKKWKDPLTAAEDDLFENQIREYFNQAAEAMIGVDQDVEMVGDDWDWNLRLGEDGNVDEIDEDLEFNCSLPRYKTRVAALANFCYSYFMNECMDPWGTMVSKPSRFRRPNESQCFYFVTGENKDDIAIGDTLTFQVDQLKEMKDKTVGTKTSVICNVVDGSLQGHFWDKDESIISTSLMDKLADKEWKPMDKLRGVVAWLEQDGMISIQFKQPDRITALAKWSVRESDFRFDSLGPLEDEAEVKEAALEEKRMEAAKSALTKLRNIRHPNFKWLSNAGALKYMLPRQAGEVLFRPSRTRTPDAPPTLIAVLKLNNEENDITQMAIKLFEIEVHEKDGTREYRVDYEATYDDLDEILARHLEPIFMNYCDLISNKKFITEPFDKVETYFKEKMRLTKQHGPQFIQYGVIQNPQHRTRFSLVWLDPNRGRSVSQEPITVTNEGYLLWNEPQPSVDKLLSWWKRKGHPLRRDYRQKKADYDAKMNLAKRTARAIFKDGKPMDQDWSLDPRAQKEIQEWNEPAGTWGDDDDKDDDFGLGGWAGPTPLIGDPTSPDFDGGKTPLIGVMDTPLHESMRSGSPDKTLTLRSGTRSHGTSHSGYQNGWNSP